MFRQRQPAVVYLVLNDPANRAATCDNFWTTTPKRANIVGGCLSRNSLICLLVVAGVSC
jgi:hypothetical protein